jgi:UDP-glucose 6-dehydrogenase
LYNSSFVYAGYCLPKDTMRFPANSASVSDNIIPALFGASRTRKEHKDCAHKVYARDLALKD